MVRVAVLSVDTSNATEEKSELDAIIERYDELLEKIEELLQPTPEPNLKRTMILSCRLDNVLFAGVGIWNIRKKSAM